MLATIDSRTKHRRHINSDSLTKTIIVDAKQGLLQPSYNSLRLDGPGRAGTVNQNEKEKKKKKRALAESLKMTLPLHAVNPHHPVFQPPSTGPLLVPSSLVSSNVR